MYLYIGNRNMIRKSDIIGLFTLKNIKNTKEYKNLKQRLTDEERLIKLSEGPEKTFVLCEKGGRDEGLISKTNIKTISKNLSMF